MQEIKKINLSLELRKFSELTINFDKERIPLSSSERESKKGKYPYYGAQGIIDHVDEYIFDGEYLLIAEDGENLNSRSQPIANVVLGKFWVNNHAHIVKTNSKCEIHYLCYLLNNINISGYITGSAQPKLNQYNLNNMVLEIQDYETQYKISIILKRINDKIKLNEKINKNLQKQINILFKSFFINFEFYDGKYQETLFGEIPIEWNIILFKDILNERNEKSTNQDIPMYSVTLDGIQPRADIYKKKITAKTTKFKIIHKYDLIFGMPNSGYQYGIMYDEIGGVSSAYPVFEINGIQPRYVDLFIKNISNYFNDIVKSGSRMGQGIDKKVLLSKEIYVPPNEHLDKYYSIESKLLDLINHNLTKLRDTLLPKLMSGEIDVSKINCDLELKYNYMKYLFNQIHTPMSKSVV